MLTAALATVGTSAKMPTVYTNLYPFTSTPLPLRSCIVKRIMLQRKERLPLNFRGNTSSLGGSLPPPARILFFLQLLPSTYNHFIVYCMLAFIILLTSAHKISEAEELDQLDERQFEEEVLRGVRMRRKITRKSMTYHKNYEEMKFFCIFFKRKFLHEELCTRLFLISCSQ